MTDKAIAYCEEHGIYEIYSEKGNIITYYSYFGSEGFVKVTHNIKTNKEERKHLRYKKTPKFLRGKYGTRYNYFTG